MPDDKVVGILGEDVPRKLDGDCYDALRAAIKRPDWKEDRPIFEVDKGVRLPEEEEERAANPESGQEITRVF